MPDPDTRPLVLDGPLLGRITQREPCVDFAVDDVPVPCRHCRRWRHECVLDRTGRPVLREWHAHGCPELAAWSDD